MNNRLIAMSLALRELELDTRIDDLADRIRLQKAIYLSQAAGVNLGYRFSWYVRGPYSTELTRDYYDYHIASGNDTDVTQGKDLRDSIKSKLLNIKPIIRAPSDASLDLSSWLELLSSYHYLFKQVANGDAGMARERLRTLKPPLAHHLDDAESALKSVGLLPAD